MRIGINLPNHGAPGTLVNASTIPMRPRWPAARTPKRTVSVGCQYTLQQ
jgi:hypothetical protein